LKWFNVLLVVLMLGVFTTGCDGGGDDPSMIDQNDPNSIYNKELDRLKNAPPTDVPTTPTVTPNRSETFTSYGERNGGRKAWRINKKGPQFGKRIKVVFSNGHTVMVNDTSHNYREGDGFVFKPGIGPNGTGDSDTGTAHGGVYLHAPYGNKSNTVTFYF